MKNTHSGCKPPSLILHYCNLHSSLTDQLLIQLKPSEPRIGPGPYTGETTQHSFNISKKQNKKYNKERLSAFICKCPNPTYCAGSLSTKQSNPFLKLMPTSFHREAVDFPEPSVNLRFQSVRVKSSFQCFSCSTGENTG